MRRTSESAHPSPEDKKMKCFSAMLHYLIGFLNMDLIDKKGYIFRVYLAVVVGM